MASEEKTGDELVTRAPDPVEDAHIDPLEPAEMVGDEGELQWVLVPVTAQDHAQRRRNMKMVAVAFLMVAAIIAGLMYKRKVDPIRALEAFDAGERFLRAARYPQAMVSFDRAISLRNDYADAFLMRARTNIARGRLRDSLPDFAEVIELRPRDPIAFMERGLAYAQIGDYNHALSDFTRTIELNPKLDAAYTQRGMALRSLNRAEEALEDFDRAVKLREGIESLLQRATTYQMIGQHQQAISDLTRVIAYEPSSPQPYFARSLSYRALGNNSAADADHAMGRKLDTDQ